MLGKLNENSHRFYKNITHNVNGRQKTQGKDSQVDYLFILFILLLILFYIYSFLFCCKYFQCFIVSSET